jgi:hypothetical protein
MVTLESLHCMAVSTPRDNGVLESARLVARNGFRVLGCAGGDERRAWSRQPLQPACSPRPASDAARVAAILRVSPTGGPELTYLLNWPKANSHPRLKLTAMPSRHSIRGRLSRWLIACTFVVCIAKLATGQDVHVDGCVRDGQYIAPHWRSHPDGDFYNNWSTKGNVNPYTLQPGTKVTPPHGYGGRATSRWFSYPNSYLPGNTSPRSNGYSSVISGWGDFDAVTKWRGSPPQWSRAQAEQPQFAPAARVLPGIEVLPSLSAEESLV